MKKNTERTRRDFIKKVAGTTILTSAGLGMVSGKARFEELNYKPNSTVFGANDKINYAVIGMGIQGHSDHNAASQNSGVELKAVCDLYDGRLKKIKEDYGDAVKTTKNYKEILQDKSIDAVIIATTDHWHDHISIEAMKAGKAVYCEKPMVHKVEEGQAVIDAQKKTKAVFQVGSQRVSSVIYAKAKELYEQGAIGKLVMAETWYDRQSALGAWQYSIPRDASEKTVDWKAYLGDAPKMDFDAKRFFRWRNYQDYGTGVAGDLFVHLFSGLHLILSSNGPTRAFTTGGLRYWKDGRDVPDVMTGVYDYPETDKHPAFNLQMRVNFIDGSGGGSIIRLVGTEGEMVLGRNITVKKSKMSSAPGFGGWDSYGTFDKQTQKEFEEWYKKEYPQGTPSVIEPQEFEYRSPKGYNE
ncbi:MAG: Gfo/Idh/MocA family oxidoreductase, partial [Cyclobacteriaceae bacterium]|nr:Gfo/Idh/MocA family oxidoreductase [Cyclobacteriaceae bacterium]